MYMNNDFIQLYICLKQICDLVKFLIVILCLHVMRHNAYRMKFEKNIKTLINIYIYYLNIMFLR